jgi:hypothetical protein
MLIEYSIQPQICLDDYKKLHLGKLISANEDKKLIGQVGYAEWNLKKDEENGVNTAKMVRANDCLGIVTFKRFHGIGSGLMERLFEELTSDGYDKLIIEGVLPELKRFYEKILGRLKKEGKISSYNPSIREYPFLTVLTPDLLFSSSFPWVYFDYEVLLEKNIQTTSK